MGNAARKQEPARTAVLGLIGALVHPKDHARQESLKPRPVVLVAHKLVLVVTTANGAFGARVMAREYAHRMQLKVRPSPAVIAGVEVAPEPAQIAVVGEPGRNGVSAQAQEYAPPVR